MIQELSSAAGHALGPYQATGIAVVLGLAVAITPGALGPGSGGLILWPLFGAVNQLLAGLAFLVVLFYLVRSRKPFWFMILPLGVMLVMPSWAMLWNMFNPETGWFQKGKLLLLVFGLCVQVLQFWLVLEALLAWRRFRQVKEVDI